MIVGGSVASARAMERGDVLERNQDVAVELDVRHVVDRAVRGEHAVLVVAAEKRSRLARPCTSAYPPPSLSVERRLSRPESAAGIAAARRHAAVLDQELVEIVGLGKLGQAAVLHTNGRERSARPAESADMCGRRRRVQPRGPRGWSLRAQPAGRGRPGGAAISRTAPMTRSVGCSYVSPSSQPSPPSVQRRKRRERAPQLRPGSGRT